jgi:hypothetical protein
MLPEERPPIRPEQYAARLAFGSWPVPGAPAHVSKSPYATQFRFDEVSFEECDMRSMPDLDFDDMRGMDVLRDFDSVYLQAGRQELSDTESEPDGDSVWLECSGELLDVGALKLVSVRKSACGFETLLFICPECNEPHESVRFR